MNVVAQTQVDEDKMSMDYDTLGMSRQHAHKQVFRVIKYIVYV